MSKNVFKFLNQRGFLDQTSSEELEKLEEASHSVYVGFDPTSDSLHLGNLVGIVALSWMEKFGHKPYALVGGATGRIGDPSGKSTERPFLDDLVLENNVKQIGLQLKTILDRCKTSTSITIMDNHQWYKNINVIDFLRDVGKHFRLGAMLAKESVKLRLNSQEGMSFTEFSYQMLQGYDFYHLFNNHQINVQMGGSDQWGNITAGLELIRRLTAKTAHGATFHLLTKSDGKKFGKTESGAVWLSAEKMIPYEFYQYLVQTADSDVIQLLKMLTFLETDEIMKLEKEMKSTDYLPNRAQKILAKEVTTFVHGKEACDIAVDVTNKARPGAEASLNAQDLIALSSNMPHKEMALIQVLNQKYTHLAAESGIVTSRSEALRLVKNQGAYLNNEKITDPNYVITEKDLIDQKYVLLGMGKKKKLLISVSK